MTLSQNHAAMRTGDAGLPLPLHRPGPPARSPVTARERKLSRVLLFLEDIIKVPLFGCRHCGECLLSTTAFICSQNCPKRLRNGPCGGTGPNGTCEVYPDRKCVWFRIYRRSRLLHRVSLLTQVNRMHDWTLEGTSAWLNVVRKRAKGPVWFIRHDHPAR